MGKGCCKLKKLKVLGPLNQWFSMTLDYRILRLTERSSLNDDQGAKHGDK